MNYDEKVEMFKMLFPLVIITAIGIAMILLINV